jgi:hypothetical protein
MLDIFYSTEWSFRADCEECGYDADVLFASGEYVRMDCGGVCAANYL